MLILGGDLCDFIVNSINKKFVDMGESLSWEATETKEIEISKFSRPLAFKLISN